jgi:hypothetical protein
MIMANIFPGVLSLASDANFLALLVLGLSSSPVASDVWMLLVAQPSLHLLESLKLDFGKENEKNYLKLFQVPPLTPKTSFKLVLLNEQIVTFTLSARLT